MESPNGSQYGDRVNIDLSSITSSVNPVKNGWYSDYPGYSLDLINGYKVRYNTNDDWLGWEYPNGSRGGRLYISPKVEYRDPYVDFDTYYEHGSTSVLVIIGSKYYKVRILNDRNVKVEELWSRWGSHKRYIIS